MSDIPKIHDKFFKEVFSHKKQMQDLIKNLFPIEIVENLDFETLQRDETEYLNSDLDEHYSDLVFDCIYKKTTELKIVFLFEHKSYFEKNIYFQLLTYILNIWDVSIKKEKTKPKIIVPIVFYHGVEEWKHESMEKYFGDFDINLRKFLPLFNYILINTKTIDDQKLKNDFEETTKLGLFLLKYIFDKLSLQTKIIDFFGEINDLIKDAAEQDLYITFYLYLKQNLKPKEMETLIETVKTKKTHVNPFVKKYYEELEEGKQEAIKLERKKQEEIRKEELIDSIKKMIAKNIANEDIAYFLDVDIKIIESVRECLVLK